MTNEKTEWPVCPKCGSPDPDFFDCEEDEDWYCGLCGCAYYVERHITYTTHARFEDGSRTDKS
jgi:predicted nucleic-acid-binding Zn-ribbon protein